MLNNPIIPGDPYSYDLKWLVDVTKDLQTRINSLDEAVQSAVEEANRAFNEAERAADQADDAEADSLKSEGFAIGEQNGVAVTKDSPYYHNNSRYYSEQAADSKQAAANYAEHIADPVSGLVTNWLTNNITQPTTPSIDKSLKVENAAADSRATGDYVLDSIKKVTVAPKSYRDGYYINISTGEVFALSGYQTSEKIYLPDDFPILYIYDGGQSLTFVAFYGADDSYLGYNSAITNGYGTILVPSGAAYFRVACVNTSDTSKFVFSNFGTSNGEYRRSFINMPLSSLRGEVIDSSNKAGEMVNGLYVNPANGRFVPAEAYRACLDLIDARDDLYVTAFMPDGGLSFQYDAIIGVFLDSSLNVVGDFRTSTFKNAEFINGFYKLTKPVTTAYVKLCVKDASDPTILYIGNAPHTLIGKDALKPEYASAEKYLTKKRVVWLGDSIIGNTQDKTAVSAYLANKTGAMIINCGFGGTRASVHTGDWDLLSAYRLADDIATGDFTTVTAAVDSGWSGMPGYFRNTINFLNKVDFSNIDTIIMSWGTNDYATPTSVLDDANNPFNITTVCGALRYAIRTILEAYPHLNIMLTCPVYRVFSEESTDSDTKDFGSGTLLDYAAAYKQVAEDMGVLFTDLYHDSGINKYTASHFFDLTTDGTHPVAVGRERIAERVAGHLIETV